MVKKRIITINGNLGSGKSSTAKMIANQLGYECYSAGDFARSLATRAGRDILASNQHNETDRTMDALVDDALSDLGARKQNLVIDAHLAWHFVPHSFKVFFTLDEQTAAERILLKGQDNPQRSRSEIIPSDTAEYVDQLKARMASERRRFKEYYDIDHQDTSVYDLVVDTKNLTMEEAAATVIDGYHVWLAQKN